MKAQTNRRLRQFHNWLGLFFAPMILLLAVSGSMQTFRLNEAGGYGGPPPRWIVWAASVHKDQRLPRPASAEAGRPATEAAEKPALAKPAPARPHGNPPSFALKVFVALLGIGLVISTLMGIAVALANRTTRPLNLALLAAGAALPLGFLYL